jgi:hypothetical protein
MKSGREKRQRAEGYGRASQCGLWEMSDLVTMIEAWEAEHAKTGTVYEVAKDTIGDGYYVRRIPRYESPETVFGFADQAAAEAWVASDRASHRPGRRRLDEKSN